MLEMVWESCERRGCYLEMKSGLAMHFVMSTPDILGPMARDLPKMPGFEKEGDCFLPAKRQSEF